VVHFTSTDPAAVLPADSTLTAGTGTFSATFNTGGPQTITATDTVTASITGTSATITASAPAAPGPTVPTLDARGLVLLAVLLVAGGPVPPAVRPVAAAMPAPRTG